MQLVKQAKAQGVRVTAEATTHHFTLTDAACASYDPVFKVHPPLRTNEDIEGIREGLRAGTIDCIATDHAPHEPHTKEFPFDHAPPGMLGLESALALAITELDLPFERIVELMSWRPAEIAGLKSRHGNPVEAGRHANLTIVNPEESWIISGAAMASRSHNTPYEGRKVRGRVRYTILEGDLVVAEGVATR